MKLILPKLPAELTAVGWKPHEHAFPNNSGLSAPLSEFEKSYVAVQKDTAAAGFPPLYQKLLTAHRTLQKAARYLHQGITAQNQDAASKKHALPFAAADATHVKRIVDACEKSLPTIQKALTQLEQMEVAAAARRGRGKVRIQLQQGHNHLWDGHPRTISAQHAIDELNRLHRENQQRFKDPKWTQALVAAIHKLTTQIMTAKRSGGLRPRGSGNQLRATFLYEKKEYRLDIEIHGDDDLDFFL